MDSDTQNRLYRRDKANFAKKLRRSMTAEEKILWSVLRSRRSQGIKFRRQVNIGPYFADFLCKEHRLIVEVDGGIHRQADQKLHDQSRDRYLHEAGYTTLRITNEEVRSDLPGVLNKISGRIDRHSAD